MEIKTWEEQAAEYAKRCRELDEEVQKLRRLSEQKSECIKNLQETICTIGEMKDRAERQIDILAECLRNIETSRETFKSIWKNAVSCMPEVLQMYRNPARGKFEVLRKRMLNNLFLHFENSTFGRMIGDEEGWEEWRDYGEQLGKDIYVYLINRK